VTTLRRRESPYDSVMRPTLGRRGWGVFFGSIISKSMLIA
jgi:hypothetical protein